MRSAVVEAAATATVTDCGIDVVDGVVVPIASVTFDNPTGAELLGRAVVDFGGEGLGEARILVRPREKVTRQVRPRLTAPVAGYDCTLTEVVFSPE